MQLGSLPLRSLPCERGGGGGEQGLCFQLRQRLEEREQEKRLDREARCVKCCVRTLWGGIGSPLGLGSRGFLSSILPPLCNV